MEASDAEARPGKTKRSQLWCCTFLKGDISPHVTGARQQMAARSLSHLENSHNASSGGIFFSLIRTGNLRIRGVAGRARHKRSFEVGSIDCGKKKKKKKKITCLDLNLRRLTCRGRALVPSSFSLVRCTETKEAAH